MQQILWIMPGTHCSFLVLISFSERIWIICNIMRCFRFSKKEIWGKPGAERDSEVRQTSLSFIPSRCEACIGSVIQTQPNAVCQASPLSSAICSCTCHVIRFERCFILSSSSEAPPLFHWHRIPLFLLPSTYSRVSMNNFFRIRAEYSAGLGTSNKCIGLLFCDQTLSRAGENFEIERKFLHV
jgi:hypothetical protein